MVTTEPLDGRYEIRRRLGDGGMATVYLAHDLRLKRDVAVKVIRDTSSETAFLFNREARVIAALHHDHIVQIFDYSGPQQDPPFIVMELIDGVDLRALLAAKPSPSMMASVAVVCLSGIAAALAHAHSRGIVHRDLKPANVMLDRDGRVLLTDLGVAKPFADRDGNGVTVVGQQTRLVGTPDYMSPEQVLEHPLGPSTDVFAFGSVLYSLFSGTSPFKRDTVAETFQAIVDIAYVDLAQYCPAVPAEIAQLCRDCFALEEGDRPAAADLVLFCEQWLSRHDVDCRAVVSSWIASQGGGPEPAPAPAMGDFGAARVATPQRIPPRRMALQRTLIVTTAEGDETDPMGVAGLLPADEPDTAPMVPTPLPATDQLAAGDFTVVLPSHLEDPTVAERLPPTVIMGPGRIESLWIAAASNVGIASLNATRSIYLLYGLGAGLAFVFILAASVAVFGDSSGGATTVVDEGGGADTLPNRVNGPGVPTFAGAQAARVYPASAAAPPAPTATHLRAVVSGMPTGQPAAAQQSPPTSAKSAAPLIPLVKGGKSSSVAARGKKAKRKRRARAAVTVGELNLTVLPWAKVFINGEAVGFTPVVRRLALPGGTHQLTVSHPELGSRRLNVRIVANKSKRVALDLRRK